MALQPLASDWLGIGPVAARDLRWLLFAGGYLLQGLVVPHDHTPTLALDNAGRNESAQRTPHHLAHGADVGGDLFLGPVPARLLTCELCE